MCELLLLANELLVMPLQHLCEGTIAGRVQLYDRPSLLQLCDALGLTALRLKIDRGSAEAFSNEAWQGIEQTIVEAHKSFSFSSTATTTSQASVIAAARRLFTKSTPAPLLIGSPPSPSPPLVVDEEVVGRIVAGTDAAKLRIHCGSRFAGTGRQTQALSLLDNSDESSMDEYVCDCLCAAPIAMAIAMARELLRKPSCDGSPSPDHRNGWQGWLNSRYGVDQLQERTTTSTDDDNSAKTTSKPAVLRQMELRLGWLLDSTAYDVILIVACSNAETTTEESSVPPSVSIFAHKAILSAATGKLAAMIRFEALDSTSSPSSSSTSVTHQQINRSLSAKSSSEPLVLRLDAVGGLSESDVRELLWQAYTGTLPPASLPSSVLLQTSVLSQNSDYGSIIRVYEKEEEEEEEIDHLLRLLWVADEFLAARWTLSLVRRLFRQLALSPHCAGSVFMAAKVLCNATQCSGQTNDDAVSTITKEMEMLVKVAALICVLTCSYRNDNNDGDYKVSADEEELLIDALQTLID